MFSKLINWWQNLTKVQPTTPKPIAVITKSEPVVPIPPPPQPRVINYSEVAVELIKRWEGYSLTAYPDDNSPLGKACRASGLPLVRYAQITGNEGMDGTPWTIGFGSTGADIVRGTRWTDQQCTVAIREHMDEKAKYVREFITVPLTQGQFDALVSFTYNVGQGNLLRLVSASGLNSGNYQSCAEAMLFYNKARNRVTGEMEVLLGLTRRRQAESKLFIGEV